MVLNCIIFLMIICAIYAYAYPDGQLAATTSAIRQIWSGSCRLNCRQSEYSGYSGLSGLIQANEKNRVTRSSHAGPSSGCVCESCPCALIENVLRTCRPATTMYSSAVDTLAAWYCSVLQMFSDIYGYVERVLNCRASCQRPPQLMATNDSGSANMCFGDKKYKQIEKDVTEKIGKTDLKATKSIIFRDLSDTGTTNARAEVLQKASSRSTPDSVALGASDATLRPNVSVTSSDSNNCSKCLEKGKICINSCPKANTRKK